MFYNAHGLLMHNMVAGNFDYVQAGMPKKKNGRFRQIIHATRRRFICGWKKLVGKLWVRRAFACFMIICAKHQQRDCYEALLELETRYCRQEPYITTGRYIHVTARKPQSKDKV